MKFTQLLLCWSGILPLVVLSACQTNPAQPSEKMESSIGWPPGVVRHPLYVLDLPNAETDRSADESATIRAFKEAKNLLEHDKAEIVVASLYADNRVLSQQAITLLLVANRIPFVEANVDDARWIFFHAKNPGAEALKARGKRFVRFKLAKDGDSKCFRGDDESPYYSFAISLPKRGGECIVVEFTDELRSRYRLGIDLTNRASRVAYYEFTGLGSDKSTLRIPFWGYVSRGVLNLPGDHPPPRGISGGGYAKSPNGGGLYFPYGSAALGFVLSRMRAPAHPN
ncbi:MAG: hypothetical protein ABIK82_07860 [Pseudomonadota bacterium]